MFKKSEEIKKSSKKKPFKKQTALVLKI